MIPNPEQTAIAAASDGRGEGEIQKGPPLLVPISSMR